MNPTKTSSSPAPNWIVALVIGSTFASLLTGCVGYNTVLFGTKSNVGLDLDSKPPTAEINISRKDIVVAPVFEGGQTPPVMASFSAKQNAFGSLGRFFFGVSQTFTGGDAAVTMAQLYNDQDENRTNIFDSTMNLTKRPKANEKPGGFKRRFQGLPEPGEVRPFVFGTDTQLGLKVGWNGTGGPYPETLKLGFSRKELAIAPLTLRTNTATDKIYDVKMPSFLATVDTDVEAGSDVKVAWLQYFATGKAADQLALKPGVRAPMLKRLDPEQATKLDLESAAKRNEARYQQIDEIIAKILSDDMKTVDKAKLTTIAKDQSGLGTEWINSFGGEPPEKLRKTLQGVDRNSVPGLYSKLDKPN